MVLMVLLCCSLCQAQQAFLGTALPTARPFRQAVTLSARRSAAPVIRAAAKQIQVDIEKPIGLNFKESKAAGGGLVVTVRHGPQSCACISVIAAK